MTNELRVHNGKLAYEIEGSGSPIIVLLHSGPLNMRMWDPQWQRLAEAGTVVRYDARGYGRSSTPAGDYSHAQDLYELLVHAELSRVFLVGISLGARTAIDFALTHPNMVDGLVLASPGISGMETTDRFILEKEAALADAVATMDPTAVVEMVLQMWVDGPRRNAGDVATGVRNFCKDLLIDNLPKQVAATGSMRELRAIDRLEELKCPVLAIAGQLDSTDIINNARRLGNEPAHGQFILLDDCGHEINLEAPERFTDVCVAFVSGQRIPMVSAHQTPV